MYKIFVKRATGMMVLSLIFGVSATFISPFSRTFAGKYGKSGKR